MIKVVIEYDGTDFYGFQKQEDKRTVQGDIEKTLKNVFKREIKIDGAGRTDRGVHAYAQVFSLDTKIDIRNIERVLKEHLPKDIRVVDMKEEKEDFHARYSATGKTYIYKVYNGKNLDVFRNKYYYEYPYELDDEEIKKAIEYFLGYHNFSSFYNKGSSAHNPFRTIHSIEFKREGDFIEIHYTGDGFLYKMVRIMTAFLLNIGRHKIDKNIIPQLFEKESRIYTKEVAPAHGLYLKEVYYEHHF